MKNRKEINFFYSWHRIVARRIQYTAQKIIDTNSMTQLIDEPHFASQNQFLIFKLKLLTFL